MRLPFVFFWQTGYGWSLSRWSPKYGRPTWRHGSATTPWFKVVW